MSEEKKYQRGENPNSLANLRAPWKPGQSGNPAGPGKGFKRVSDRIKAILEQEVPELSGEFDYIKQLLKENKSITVNDVLAAVTVYKALHGNFKYMKLIMDRLEGPVTKRIEAELTNVTDIDNMTDEELLILSQSIKQKRLSIDQGSSVTGIPD